MLILGWSLLVGEAASEDYLTLPLYQIKALILLATRRQSYFSHKNHHHITIKVPFQYCHAKKSKG
jgi:hypothetical protein